MASEFPGEKSRVRSVASGCPASFLTIPFAKHLKYVLCPLSLFYALCLFAHIAAPLLSKPYFSNKIVYYAFCALMSGFGLVSVQLLLMYFVKN